ncbi:MAG: Crp/Fnr family transcriptional regulator [Cytophagales bacterium]|nr:Crp/Fnr family transcriptional regulator [Cytophagales bacterium]
MIKETILCQYPAARVRLNKGEILFDVDTPAHYYYQIISGEMKMCNFNEEGKEFVQGLFRENESFGEPPLFGEFEYPAAAYATKETVLWRLPKQDFLQLLLEHPAEHLEFTQWLGKRLYYKSIMQREISQHQPERRILALIDFLKKEIDSQKPFEVPLTRQQIADMTGLRVETVIRTIKKLQKNGAVEIKNHKVYR